MCAAAACSLAPLDRPACHTRLPLLVTALLKVLAMHVLVHDYTLCTMHYALCTYCVLTMSLLLLKGMWRQLTEPSSGGGSKGEKGGEGGGGAHDLSPPEAATLCDRACNPMRWCLQP